MKNGGFIMYSKKEVYELMPVQFYPKTELIKEYTPFNEVLNLLRRNELAFPLIAKPDIGLRGFAVKKINNVEDLKRYHSKVNFDYLLQEFIPYENEIGVFYLRFPNEKSGKVTGIVSKEFMIVEGDGVSTIEELIKANPRFELQLNTLIKEYGSQMNSILPVGKKINLVPYGNHCRGTKFVDVSDRINDDITSLINDICIQIPEFYYGRLDIRYNTWGEFENGEKFSILELNGANSEPAHIYDERHSLFYGWKELVCHISSMYQISIMNKKRGYSYLTFKNGFNEYFSHIRHIRKLNKFYF
jgi:hypothetical protein